MCTEGFTPFKEVFFFVRDPLRVLEDAKMGQQESSVFSDLPEDREEEGATHDLPTRGCL